MAGLAEAIVIGSKLYKAGKQISNSAKSVKRGLETHEKKQQIAQKKQFQQQNKMVNQNKPKPVQKNTSTPKPAVAKPVKTAQKAAPKPKTPSVNNKRR